MYCIDTQTGIKYKITMRGNEFRRIQAIKSDDSYWFTLKEFEQYFQVLH
jgi:hypothetical protein